MTATDTLNWTFAAGIDRGGAAAYLHLVRAADDPERSGAGQDVGRGWASRWKNAAGRSVDDCIADLRVLLDDGQARTFNRIAVELYDVTADVLFAKNPDLALWAMVEAGEVEHTLAAPILFRRRDEGEGATPRQVADQLGLDFGGSL